MDKINNCTQTFQKKMGSQISMGTFLVIVNNLVKAADEKLEIEIKKPEYKLIKECLEKYYNVIVKKRNLFFIASWKENNFSLNKNSKIFLLKNFIISLFIFFNSIEVNKISNSKEIFIWYSKINDFLSIIPRLKHENFFSSEDVLFILKFLMQFSLVKYNDTLDKKELEKNFNISSNKINHFFFIKLSFNLFRNSFNAPLTKEDEEAMIKFLDFFSQNILKNEHNLNLLKKVDHYTINVVQLLTIVSISKNPELSSKIKEIISKLYADNFSYRTVVSPFATQIRDLMFNLDIKPVDKLLADLPLPIAQIDYLVTSCKNEANQQSRVFWKLKNSLFFSYESNGINFELPFQKKFLVVFGYQSSSNFYSKDPTKVLFSFDETGKNYYEKFDFCIEKNKIVFKFHQNQNQNIKEEAYPTNIEIADNVTYFFFVDFEYIKKKKFQLSINYFSEKNSFPTYKVELDITIEKNKKNFTYGFPGGYFGALFIFKNSFEDNKDFYMEMFRLTGRYESMLWILSENYNSTFCNQIYEENLCILLGNLFSKMEIKSKQKLLESIIAFVSPRAFTIYDKKIDVDYLSYESSDIAFSSCTINERKCKFNHNNYIKISSRESTEFLVETADKVGKVLFVVENSGIMSDFVKFDGFKYLCLVLEYCYQVIVRRSEEEEVNNEM